MNYPNNKQKDNGVSMERVYQYLADNPNYAKLRTLVDNKSVIIDTAADFQPLHHTAKFRNLQLRILQVYRKAAAGMHTQNAGHP